jgi:ubiquinone/menaquinone biosynthesis C-methylase UbiE
MENTEHFTNRAEHYRKYRPGYPDAVTKLMREECGLLRGARVADIGAGTGILTRLLLEAGFEVSAVEPNADMRRAAEEDLGQYPAFRAVAAPAEATGLADGAVEAITVAQAFHWFDHAKAGVEFRRILRPGGWMFIIRNHRQAEGSALARDFESLMKNTLGEAYAQAAHRDRGESGRKIREFFPAGAVRLEEFDNPQTLDWTGLRGRMLSVSYAPAEGEPGHKELIAGLEDIFKKHERDGVITFEQKTEVYYGRLGE